MFKKKTPVEDFNFENWQGMNKVLNNTNTWIHEPIKNNNILQKIVKSRKYAKKI